jgi:hypothetical protein
MKPSLYILVMPDPQTTRSLAVCIFGDKRAADSRGGIGTS